MLASSMAIVTFPSDGYRAGYDAVIARGHAWVESEVIAAMGNSLPACNDLHRSAADAFAIDYGDFVKGCSDGVDHLAGRHVPVLADRR